MQLKCNSFATVTRSIYRNYLNFYPTRNFYPAKFPKFILGFFFLRLRQQKAACRPVDIILSVNYAIFEFSGQEIAYNAGCVAHNIHLLKSLTVLTFLFSRWKQNISVYDDGRSTRFRRKKKQTDDADGQYASLYVPCLRCFSMVTVGFLSPKWGRFAIKMRFKSLFFNKTSHLLQSSVHWAAQIKTWTF